MAPRFVQYSARFVERLAKAAISGSEMATRCVRRARPSEKKNKPLYL